MAAQLHLSKPVKCFTLSLPAPALLLQAQRVTSMLCSIVCVCVVSMIIRSHLSPVMYCLSWVHLRMHCIVTNVSEKCVTLFDSDV